MTATLLIAAHGTRSAAGSATTAALRDAVAAARPEVVVSLGFLDVATPSLADALDALHGPVTVVPLLLSAGYHVETDIPAIVAGRAGVQVARHLGPDPAVITAVADRLAEAGGTSEQLLLAAIASSRASARAEVDLAAERLGAQLGRPVDVLPLGGDTVVDPSSSVATYLLAEGGFLDALRARTSAPVAEPIGVHPALVDLVWARYDELNPAGV